MTVITEDVEVIQSVLHNRNVELEAEVSRLQGRLSGLLSEISALESSNAILRDEIRSLKGE